MIGLMISCFRRSTSLSTFVNTDNRTAFTEVLRLCPVVRIILNMVKPPVVPYVNDTVQEEPAFLRRMRAGFQQEDDKVDEKRRRRGSEEIIDEDEAPQVIISEKDKDKIAED